MKGLRGGGDERVDVMRVLRFHRLREAGQASALQPHCQRMRQRHVPLAGLQREGRSLAQKPKQRRAVGARDERSAADGFALGERMARRQCAVRASRKQCLLEDARLASDRASRRPERGFIHE